MLPQPLIQNQAFDDAYTEFVEKPWQAVADLLPWNAPTELRQEWEHSITHTSDPLKRLVSAIGLSRSAGLTLHEVETIDAYISQHVEDFDNVNVDVVALLLCTGATPPPILFPAYFEPCLKASAPHPPPILWLCLSWYLRAPGNIEVASAFLRHKDHWWPSPYGRFLIAQSLLNPLLAPPDELFHEWLQAEATFHPRKMHPTMNLNADLLFFAWAMRWDTTKIPTVLRPAFQWLIAQKSVLRPHDLPVEELTCPTQTTIQSFASNTELNEVYKYYLPLLRYPWESPSLPAFAAEGSVVALALAGHPPFLEWCKQRAPRSLEMLEAHPCWGLF